MATPGSSMLPRPGHTRDPYEIQSDLTWASGGQDTCDHLLREHKGPVLCVDCEDTREGSQIATGGEDCEVMVWRRGVSDAEAWQATLQGHTKAVTSVKWRPGGGVLASGSKDGTVKLWAFDKDLPTHKI